MLIPCFSIGSLALVITIQDGTCLVVFPVNLLEITIFPSTMSLLV